MKIECTVQELRELLQKEAPAAETTDAKLTDNQLEQINSYLCQSY